MLEGEFYRYLEKLKSSSYKKQDHWDLYKEKFFKILSDYKSMDSFRSNGISNMLETGLPSQDIDKILQGITYNRNYDDYEKLDIVKRYRELRLMFGDKLDEIFFNSEIGKPRGYEFDDKNNNLFLNFDDLYHVYSAAQISRVINYFNFGDKVNRILEIGGGYGNLATKLKKLFPNIQYLIIDLPEVLLIQHYYLSKTFPDKKIIKLIDNSNI